MYFVIVLFSMIATSLAQVPMDGPCPVARVMDTFSPTQILGQWYGYARYPTCDPDGRCRRTNFIDNGDGSMEIVVKQLSVVPNEFSYYTVSNRAEYAGHSVFTIASPVDERFAELSVNQSMIFLRTDYVNYLVKGACVNFGNRSLHWNWILTRSPNPSESTIANINRTINDLRLVRDSYERWNQTGCPEEY